MWTVRKVLVLTYNVIIKKFWVYLDAIKNVLSSQMRMVTMKSFQFCYKISGVKENLLSFRIQQRNDQNFRLS